MHVTSAYIWVTTRKRQEGMSHRNNISSGSTCLRVQPRQPSKHTPHANAVVLTAALSDGNNENSSCLQHHAKQHPRHPLLLDSSP